MKRKCTLRSCNVNLNVKSSPSKRIKLTAKRDIQQRAFEELLELRRQKNGGQKIHGDICRILDMYAKSGYGELVTRKNLEYRMRKYRDIKQDNNGHDRVLNNDVNAAPSIPQFVVDCNTSTECHISLITDDVYVLNTNEEFDNETNEESDKVSNNDVMINNPVRKRGKVSEERNALKQLMNDAKSAITIEFKDCLDKCKALRKRTPNNALLNIIHKKEEELLLPKNSISQKTIRKRIKHNNFNGSHRLHLSPLHQIEPLIVDFCIRSFKIGLALNKQDIISITRELIKGTVYETYLKERKDMIGIKYNEENVLGDAWYKGFLKRNNIDLKRAKVTVKDAKRHTWCTYEHFECMYEHVYEQMVAAKVAKKVDTSVMYDVDGNITRNEEEMVGRPTKYVLTHPENILFVDETGCNTNSKHDGRVGGELFVIPTEHSAGGLHGCTNDVHFTVLCFTSGNGDPVMCAVILKSKEHVSKIPISWKMGIDIRKNIKTGENVYKQVETNVGVDSVMHGGPRCTYNGKEIPCFVGTSPNASITSEMLVEMLKTFDSLDIFNRDDGRLPFLLLDGHHSRLQIPFLEYINNKGKKWMVCVGVPYGTHIWQVHDSSELNGCFKMALVKAKREYLRLKTGHHFVMTDIIPLVTMAWEKSFARRDKAKKAIISRGWGPLNYRLLDHPELIRDEKQSINQNPNSDSLDVTSLNTDGPCFQSILDKVIEVQLKDKGRQEKYLLEKALINENRKKFSESMDSTKKITSGKLAANNHFCLSDEKILELVKEQQANSNKQQEARDKRKQLTLQKSEDAFSIAFQKYKNNLHLKREDLLSLIRQVKIKDDPTIGKTIAEIKTHWDSIKHRLNRFLPPIIKEKSREALINTETTPNIFPEAYTELDICNGIISSSVTDQLSMLAFLSIGQQEQPEEQEGVSLNINTFEI